MSCMNINVGDFLLTKDKEVFMIINKMQTFGNAIYDIKSYKKQLVTDSFNVAAMDLFWEHRVIKGIAHNALRHLGTIIPAKDFSPALEILYK